MRQFQKITISKRWYNKYHRLTLISGEIREKNYCYMTCYFDKTNKQEILKTLRENHERFDLLCW